MGPNYVKPQVQAPKNYKWGGEWKAAEPKEDYPKGPWWKLFNDEQLNQLESQVDINNQNIAGATAQYHQALAFVRSAKAQYFPSVSVGAGYSQVGTSTSPAQGIGNYLVNGQVSWEMDFWGRIRRTVESSKANAQASIADLETIRLSVHAALAQDYFLLRSYDIQKQLLDDTVAAYSLYYELTKARFDEGIASKADVFQAQTQLDTARAQAIDIQIPRAQTEHAIAILMGKPPSEFSISFSTAPMNPPSIPAGLPSELLERRPDIAAAERRVQAANAQIGVAKAAYFPALTLGAASAYQSTDISTLFLAPNPVWSYGPLLFDTIFSGGAKRAQTAQARAAYEASVAAYKQAVLIGFQQVEDNLAALKFLDEEARVQDNAVSDANETLSLTLDEYIQGTASSLNVVTAQAAELNVKRQAISILSGRMSASVLLIQSLGGGWHIHTASRNKLPQEVAENKN